MQGNKEFQEIGTLRTGMRNIKNKKAKMLEINHTLVLKKKKKRRMTTIV